jgi:hypothetical protein
MMVEASGSSAASTIFVASSRPDRMPQHRLVLRNDEISTWLASAHGWKLLIGGLEVRFACTPACRLAISSLTAEIGGRDE